MLPNTIIQVTCICYVESMGKSVNVISLFEPLAGEGVYVPTTTHLHWNTRIHYKGSSQHHFELYSKNFTAEDLSKGLQEYALFWWVANNSLILKKTTSWIGWKCFMWTQMKNPWNLETLLLDCVLPT